MKHPVSVHGQFRHARLTEKGTLLVAHMGLNKVVEYGSDGNELWSFPAERPWGVTPLANGNVLITDHIGVREVTRLGDLVWTFSPSDVPGYRFANLQQAWRLPNGNSVVNKLGERMEPVRRKRSGNGASPGVDSSQAGGVGAAGVDSTREPGARNHHPVSG